MQNIGPLLPLVSKSSLALPVGAKDSGDAFASILGQAVTAPLQEPASDAPAQIDGDALVLAETPDDSAVSETEILADESAVPADLGLPPLWPQFAVPPAVQASASTGPVGTGHQTSGLSGLAVARTLGVATDAQVNQPLIASRIAVPPIPQDTPQTIPDADVLPESDITPHPVAATDRPKRGISDLVGLPLPVAIPTENQASSHPAFGRETLLHMQEAVTQQAIHVAAQSAPAITTAPLVGLRVAEAALRPVVTAADPSSGTLQSTAGMTVRVIAQSQHPMALAEPVVVIEGESPLDIPRDAVSEARVRDQQAVSAVAKEKADGAPVEPQPTRAAVPETPVAFVDSSVVDIAVAVPLPNTLVPVLGSGVSATASTAGAIPMAALPQVVAQALRDDPGRQVELRLDPPELGSVRFQLDQRNSDLVVTIIAERPETLDLMRRHSEQLLADLRQAGFAGASLNFGTSQGQGGQGQGGFGQGGFGQGAAQNSNANAPAPSAAPHSFSAPTPPPRSTAQGVLNLRL